MRKRMNPLTYLIHRYFVLIFISVTVAMIFPSCMFFPDYWEPHSDIQWELEEWYSRTFNSPGYFEERCKLTLRALGSTELAYQDQNENHEYGTWEILIDPKNYYIQEGYTLANIIDEYTIPVFKVTSYTVDNLTGRSNNYAKFLIVAIPSSKKYKLRTFALCEDQTPMVWIGDDKLWSFDNITLDDPKLWEPLR